MQKEKRFGRDPDLTTIKRWQARQRSILLTRFPRRRIMTGTLMADAPAFLATLSGRTKDDYENLLQHWIDSPLGSMRRDAITKLQIRTQLSTWRAEGVAASTLNKRLLALRRLYTIVDESDENAINPTHGIRKFTEPEPEPREIPRAILEAILAALPEQGRAARGEPRPQVSKTKARLRVMAETGLPPKQIMQLRPDSIDWARRTVLVTPRRKGKGTKPKTLPLLPEAVEALRAFAAADAWGSFSTSAVYKSFQVACRALEHALTKSARAATSDAAPVTLPHWRPYDLRHSFGTELYRHSGDQRAVQEALLHAKSQTTHRYTLGAVDEKLKAAIDRLAASRVPAVGGGVPAGASAPPLTVSKRRQKRLIPARLARGQKRRKSL